MSETTTLRQLSRDYAQGRLTQAQYREQRARLLDGLFSGALPLTPYQPPATPPVDPGEKSSTTLQGIRLVIPQSLPGSSRQPLWLAAAAIVVIAAGAGIYFLHGGQPAAPVAGNPPAAPQATTAGAPAPSPEMTPPAAAPASSLLEDFLRDTDWKKDSLNRFAADWAALNENDRSSLKQSPAYRDLVDGTYSQIIKEEALLGLGDDKEVLDREDVLIHFADQMGFSGERFKEAAAKMAKLRAAQTAAATPPAAAPAAGASPEVAQNAPASPPAAPAVTQAPEETRPAAAEAAAPATAAAVSAAAETTAPAATTPEGASTKEKAAEKTPREAEKPAAAAVEEAPKKEPTAAEKAPPASEKVAPAEPAAEAAAKPESTEAPTSEAKAAAKPRRTLECYAELAKE